MKSGPKPKPRNLRVIEGTIKPSRDNPDQPRPTIAAPPVPKYLKGKERAVFRKTARLLAGMRVISAADVDALIIYSVSFSRWQKLVEEMRDETEIITTATGAKKINPKLQAIDKCQDHCHKLLAEFGLTPSARNRVTAQ